MPDPLAAEGVRRICVIGSILVLATAAGSSDFAACFDRAHSNYRDAQRRWHRALHLAVLEAEPTLGALSEINTELQLAFVAQAEKRIRAFASRSPPGLRFESGLSGLLNPSDWSSRDESELRTRDPEYAELAERVAILRPQNDGHSDWPALRALIRTEVMASPSVKQVQGALRRAGEEFVREARSCRHPQ